MDILFDFIKSLGFWGGATLIVFGLVWHFHCSTLVENAASRAAALAALRDDTAGKRYRRWLTRALDGLDAELSKDESALPPTSARVAWSGGLAGFNFALALAYPMFSVLALCLVTGNGTVAGRVVIGSEDSVLLRCFAAIAIFVTVLVIFFADWRGYGTKKYLLKLGALLLLSTIAATLVSAGEGESATAIFAACGVIGAAEAARSGTRVGAFGFVLFIASFALSVNPIVGFIGLGVAVLAVFPIERWAVSKGISGAAFTSLGIIFLGLILTIFYLKPQSMFDANGSRKVAIFLFISFLPLLNGLADFASCGLTRWLMRRGLAGQTVWRGVMDSVAGLGIFLVLGFAIITVVHFVRPQNGVPLADLTAIFDGLADPTTRGSYGWLLFMLATTLIPTVLHFAVAVAAFFTLYPACLRHWIIERLESGAAGHANAGRLGQAALALAIAAAVLIPSRLLWHIFTMRHGMLDGLITVFRLFAESIGAIPSGMAI